MTDTRHAGASHAGRTESMPTEPRFGMLWALLTYVVATNLLAFPAYVGRFLVTTHSDQYIAGFAFRQFAAESLRSGHGFPLWNPFLQGGMPFVAAMHGDIFYPTFLLRMVLPTDVAMTWGFIIHVVLAGLFTYGFLRAVGVSFWGALVGGLVYLMSGPIAGYVSPGHDGKLFVSALLPLACWLLTLGIRQGRGWSWGALALVVGLAVLSPHPQLLQYMLLAAGSFALWLVLEQGENGPVVPRPLALRRLGYALGSVVLGFLMGAVQYLPVREYVAWSPRAGGKGWDHAVSYSMPLEELVSTYVPQFSGILDAYWGRNGIHFHSEYFGAAALFLAAAGIFWTNRQGRRGFTWFWVGTFVVSLLWTLGGSTPFYHIVYAIVPGTKFFRAPSTMMYVSMFAVAVLAALGTERLLTARIGRRYLISWLIGAGLVALLATAGGLTNLATSVAMPGREAAAEANHGALVLGAWRSFLFVLAAAAVAWAVRERRIAPRVAGMLLVGVLAIDFWSVLRNYWKFMPGASEVYAADATVAAMKSEREPYRVLPIQLTAQAAYHDPFLNGDALMVHEVPNVIGYHGNELGRYQVLAGKDQGYEPLIRLQGLREMLNVKFLLTNLGPDVSLDPNDSTFTLLRLLPGSQHVVGPVQNAAGTTVHLYRLGGAAEAAWVAASIVKAPDEGVLATVRDPRFDESLRRRVALLDTGAAIAGRDPAAALPEPSTIRASVQRQNAGYLTVRLSAPAPEGTALVVSENYYPGWTAAVNGAQVPVYRANYTLMGIPLPQGATEVELRFDSEPYRTGKLITLAAIAAAVLLMGAAAIRPRSSARV